MHSLDQHETLLNLEEHRARRCCIFVQYATGKDTSSFPSFILGRVDTLARIAKLLGLDEPTRFAYTKVLSKLSADQLQAEFYLMQMKKVEMELEDMLRLARHRKNLAASWCTEAEDSVPDTASLERQKKSMSAKAKEYQRDLSTFTTCETSPENDEERSITSLISHQERLRFKEQQLSVLRARLRAFEELPPNLELAKVELTNAREYQIQLLNIREKLLGRMAHGLN